MPPISAGEPQRSLIKGRGQYYKNYQNVPYQPIGSMPPVPGAADQLTSGFPPKHGLHEDYLLQADDYASKVLAGTA